MSSFDPAFQRTVGIEGVYDNDPDDPGGETKFGITVGEARAFGYQGPMIDLDLETAKSIYRQNYWDKMGLSLVVDQSVAEEMFDTGVNCGAQTAVRIAQEALNCLNKGGSLWPDLAVDGQDGPATVGAINACAARSKALLMNFVKLLNCLQAAYYVRITEKNQRLEKFFFGWLDKRVTL